MSVSALELNDPDALPDIDSNKEDWIIESKKDLRELKFLLTSKRYLDFVDDKVRDNLV